MHSWGRGTQNPPHPLGCKTQSWGRDTVDSRCRVTHSYTQGTALSLFASQHRTLSTFCIVAKLIMKAG